MQPERSQRFDTALDMRRALSAFAGQLSLAGRVAATASLDDRPAQVSLAPAGTQKVPISPEVPLPGTAEMSQFRGSPAASPRAPLGIPVVAAAAPPAAALSPAAPPAAEARTRPGKLIPQKPISRTAEMPQQPGRALTPTLSTPDLPPPLEAPARKRRGRGVLVGLMILGALTGAAVSAVWFLESRGLIELRTDPGPPPPRPMPQPGSKFAPLPQSAAKP
jgi:hypothetical protein